MKDDAQVEQACALLEHYHMGHTDDKITRFRGKFPIRRRNSMSVWYETCVSQDGQVRDVMVRATLESAKRGLETLRIAWPNFDMIFIRQHGRKRPNRTSQESFRVLHKLTIKRATEAP